MLTASVLLPLIAGASTTSDADVAAKARALNQKLLNVDAHTDVLIDSTPERYWAPGHGSRTDLAKLTSGSVDVVALAIAVGPGPRTPEGVAEARKEADAKLATIRQFAQGRPETPLDVTLITEASGL